MTLLLFLCSVTARAASSLETLGSVLPAGLLSAMTEDEANGLLEACPDEAALVDCLGATEDAQALLGAAQERAVQALVERVGEGLVEQFGDPLLALDEAGWRHLEEACSEATAETIADCFNEALASVPAAGVGDGELAEIPPEARELLPAQFLDNLPPLITKFLDLPDYQAIAEFCARPSEEEVMACIGGEEFEPFAETLIQRGVIRSMTDFMDVELALRLDHAALDGIADACDKDGEAWADCVLKHGDGSEECYEAEDTLASCIVTDDRVTSVYQVIQTEKKAVFGPDLYVEFRGLMSTMPIDNIKIIRERCPQTELEALWTCFEGEELVGELIAQYIMIGDMIAEELAKELAESGVELSQAQREEFGDRFAGLFLTFPFQAVQGLANECEQRNPEFETIESLAEVDAMFECLDAASDTSAVANPAFISPERLKRWLEIARGKVTDAIREKEAAAQARAATMITKILALLGGVGFIVILLMPLSLKRKYPRAGAMLWKASAIAATTFLVTIVALGVSLTITRAVQGAVATESTSPKMVVANGVFDVLGSDQNLQDLSDMSRERLDFIKTPLRNIVESDAAQGAVQGAAALASEVEEAPTEENYVAFTAYLAEHWASVMDEPELKAITKNAAMVKGHIESFKGVFKFYRRVNWLMGYVPILMSLLAVLLYLIPLRETLIEIAMAPARAAEGDKTDMVENAKKLVLGELLLVGPFLVAMMVILITTGAFLSIAVEPFIEILLSYTLDMVFYIIKTEASAFVLYGTLLGAILLLVGCLALYILAMTSFLGAMRNILRARFHNKRPLGDHGAFWIYGSVATLWLLVFPMLYAFFVSALAFQILIPDENAELLTATDMVLVPFGGLVLLPVVFWAARGLKAMGYLKRYAKEVEKRSRADAAAAKSAALAAAEAAELAAAERSTERGTE